MPFTIEREKASSSVEPITFQPTKGFIAAFPQGRGRRALTETSGVILEQKTDKESAAVDPNDTLTLNTEFRIMNTKWQPILNYVEESDFFLRALWGRLRPLYMRFNELSGEALFYAYRKNNCCRCGCCCQSCHEAMLVEMDDIYVGQIQHKRRFWKPIYSIVDAQGFPVYSVVGRRAPGCRICCRPLEVKFQITKAGMTVGEILKRRSFFLPDVRNERPFTKITFPSDASVVEKAMLICAAFYIEVHYWDIDPMSYMK